MMVDRNTNKLWAQVLLAALLLAIASARAQEIAVDTLHSPAPAEQADALVALIDSAPLRSEPELNVGAEEPVLFRRRRQASMEMPRPPPPGFNLSPQPPSLPAGDQLAGGSSALPPSSGSLGFNGNGNGNGGGISGGGSGSSNLVGNSGNGGTGGSANNGRESGSGSGGMLGFLSQLGPTLERAQRSAQLLQSLLGNPSSSQQQQQAYQQPLFGGSNQQQTSGGSSGPNTLQLMSAISELVRSTQDSNKQQAANPQPQQLQLQQAQQQGSLQSANQPAQGTTGFKAALSEVGSGLQRIVLNNPQLVPEIKNLYQSVSAKLSSPSSSSSSSSSSSWGGQPMSATR